MAMYQCHECGQFIDDDYHPGIEPPQYKRIYSPLVGYWRSIPNTFNPSELICPDCADKLQPEG